MKRIFILSCVGYALLILSCGTSRKASKAEHKILEPVTVVAGNNPFDIYRASAPLYWDIIHTKAALSFDFSERTADGRAWIQLKPYFYATDSLILDAKGMEIDSVMFKQGNRYELLGYKYADNKLHIRLGKMYMRNDSIELYIRYKAKPYANTTGGSKAITDDRGLYFINTRGEVQGKPVQIWTQGETEANAHWLPTIDHPNERMTMELQVTVPDSFTTLSNGTLVQSLPAEKNMRTDVWKMQQPIQVYAVMMAIGKFTVVKDKSWRDVEIDYYVEPEYATYAKKMFQNTPEMMDYFSTITGVPYPWNKYSQVVVRVYVSGAMENTTASLFGEFMNQNFREIADKNYEDIVSHELFHQWFGDYVTAESWSNLTVNESFANYGEQLWRGYKYGPASRDELAFNDLSKYLNQASFNDEPLVRFHYRSHEDMFDRISYEKGGAILHYLHRLIGDEAFSEAMKRYLTKHALQSAEVHQWRLVVEDVTGKDWNWFFNQWYYRGGHPTLSLRYAYDDQSALLTVHVDQYASDSGKPYLLPLKAALIYGDSGIPEVIDWTVDSRKQHFIYPYRNGVKPVFVPDYEHWLVGTIREDKRPEQWLAQYKTVGDYINKRRALSGAFTAQSVPFSKQLFELAIKDSLEGIRTYALELLEHAKSPDWQRHFTDVVSKIAVQDPHHRVRAAAFDVLGNWKIKDMRQPMIKAVSDSSYMVAGSALNALRIIDQDTAYRLAKYRLGSQPKADLENAAWWSVASRGVAEDISLFEQNASKAYGSKKLAFAATLYKYILQTPNRDAFKKGLTMLTKLTGEEAIKSYRFAVGSMVFAAFEYYQEQSKNASDQEKKTEVAERLKIAQRYWERVLEEEEDPGNLSKYKSL